MLRRRSCARYNWMVLSYLVAEGPEMKRKKKVLPNDAGMTITELMIATAVMVGVFVFLIGTIATIHATRGFAEDRAQAVGILSSVVEDLRSLSSTGLPNYVYVPPQLLLGSSQTVEVRAVDAGGAEVTLPVDPALPPPTFPNPTEVRVGVRWTDARGGSYVERASVRLRE